MHYLIITVGSAGDVFPVVTLAAGLISRGHRATLIAAPAFEQLAAHNRINFVPLSGSDDHDLSMRRKYLMMTRYAAFYNEQHSVDWNRVIHKTICALPKDDLILLTVDRPNAWGDMFAKATLGVPALRLQIDLPYIGRPIGHTDLLPFTSVQRLLAARCEAKWRTALGSLGSAAGHLRFERLGRSVGRTIPAIALWPLWILGEGTASYACPTFGFLPPPEFPARDQSEALPDPMGRRLIVFVAGTTGTTRSWERAWVETSARVCERLGCMGVLLGGDGEQMPASAWVVRRRFLPLSNLLPMASAIVHHGGIGTAAAAIRHGVPQLIVPRVFAQPGNADWLRRLGLCKVIDSTSYTLPGVTGALSELLDEPEYRERAGRFAARANSTGALSSVCDYLESPDLVDRLRSCAPREIARRSWYRQANRHVTPV